MGKASVQVSGFRYLVTADEEHLRNGTVFIIRGVFSLSKRLGNFKNVNHLLYKHAFIDIVYATKEHSRTSKVSSEYELSFFTLNLVECIDTVLYLDCVFNLSTA